MRTIISKCYLKNKLLYILSFLFALCDFSNSLFYLFIYLFCFFFGVSEEMWLKFFMMASFDQLRSHLLFLWNRSCISYIMQRIGKTEIYKGECQCRWSSIMKKLNARFTPKIAKLDKDNSRVSLWRSKSLLNTEISF